MRWENSGILRVKTLLVQMVVKEAQNSLSQRRTYGSYSWEEYRIFLRTERTSGTLYSPGPQN